MHFEDATVIESLRAKGYKLISKDISDIEVGSYYELRPFCVKYDVSMKNKKEELLCFSVKEEIREILPKFFNLILFGNSDYIKNCWESGFLKYGWW